jgi:hypothetical protein
MLDPADMVGGWVPVPAEPSPSAVAVLGLGCTADSSWNLTLLSFCNPLQACVRSYGVRESYVNGCNCDPD